MATATKALSEKIPIINQRTSCAEKNDKLGWKDGFAVRLEGRSLGVRTNNPELLPRLRDFMPPEAESFEERQVDALLSFFEAAPSTRRGSRNYHLVYDAWNRVSRTLDFEEAMAGFERAVKFYRMRFSRDYTFVLASVVDWKSQGVVILGERKSGRTTLCELLEEHGAKIHTSDYAIIDQDGALRAWSPEIGALEPAIIIETFYDPGRTFRPAKKGAGEMAMKLLSRAPNARVAPQRALPAVAKLSERCQSYRGRRGEAIQVLRFLERRLG